MTYSPDLRIAEVVNLLSGISKTFISSLNQAEEAYANLLEAKGTWNNTEWAQVLHGLPSVSSSLTVSASLKTVSCVPGANLFVPPSPRNQLVQAFQPGRKVTITGMSNGGNNITNALITSVSPDVLEFSDIDTFVDETGTEAEAATQPTQDELDRTAALVDAGVAMHELYEAATNVAVATEDRMDVLRRIS